MLARYCKLSQTKGAIFFAILLLFSVASYGQAPGGVASNLGLWLKANSGPENSSSLPAANGEAISVWRDQSGLALDYTSVAGPVLITNALNYNPAVQIQAGGFDAPAGASLGTNWTTFFVSRKLASDNNGRVFEGHTSNYLWAHWSNFTNSIYLNGNPANHNVGIATTTGIQNLHLHTYKRESAGGTLEARADGTSLTTFGTSNSASGIRIDINQGAFSATESSHSQIGEMIVYNAALTNAEIEQVESYLGLKYGLTLSHDYLASNGSVIWDYAINAAYNTNITGIGRDDNSSLNQQTSTSINAGTDLTIAATAAFGADLSYLIMGDNNATNGTSGDVPTGHARRLNKVWRSEVLGNPGTVTLTFDLTDLGLPTALAASDYVLLIDNDGVFTTVSSTVSGASIASRAITFNNVTLNDSDYVTVAVLSSSLVGPANVTENLRLWLRADDGVTGTTPVASWADQAGNGFVATAPGNAPDLLTNQLNGNPVIDFTSSNSEFLSIPNGLFGSSTFNHAWAYVVSKADVLQNNTAFFESLTGGEGFSALIPWSNSNIYYDYGTLGGNGRINGVWGGSLNNFNFWTLGASTTTATPNGTRKAISRDGQVILSNDNSEFGTGNNQPFLIGGGYSSGAGTSNPLDGKIAELIVFTGVPSELEQEKIHSYLAVKYGITKNSLDIAGTAGQDERDYFDSNGSVIWDFSNNSTYHNRVTGIGRDDGSQLSQLSSQSVLTGSIFAITATSFTTDNSYILTGDDNGTLAATSVGVPSPYTRRVTRIWKAGVSGSPGSVSVSFDLSTGIHNSGNVSDYALLIKNSNTDFSAGATIHTTGATLLNNVLTFTNVTLSNGDFFTIGLNVTTPGSLQPVFWVKAGSGVTGTTDVSLWADQSGQGNNASQAVLANQPSLLNSDVNYNPSINFSGNTDIMTPASAPANLNSTIFTVAVPGVNTSWRTMFRGTVNDHPIIVQNGGNNLGYYDNSDVGFKASGFTWLQNEPALVGLEMRTGDVNFRKNGTQGASIATIDLTGLNLNYFGNYQGNNQPFGRIAETIVFNGAALTTSEKERIESYLAIKYGISLSHNFYSYNGTLLWDVTTNALYSNRIIGLGRDDAAGLDQRKSKSVHSSTVLTIEKSNPASAFGSDQDFLLVGDDNGLLGATPNNVHPSYSMRVSRIWNAVLNGTPGSLTVTFDLGSGIYNSGNAADYAIIIKNGDTDFSVGASAHTTGASLVGNVLTFSNVSLSTGDFFTLALPRIASPGGIIDNLRLWLRADVGITGGGNVSAWADQTSYYYLATQGTVANQPALLTNRVNFNPSIQFDGSDDQLSILGGIMGTATYSDINVFAVTRVNAVQNSSIFFETQASGGRINAHLPWGNNDVYWDAGGSAAPYRLNVNWGGSVGTPYLWSLLASTSSTALGANQNIVRNGRSISSDATMATFTGNGSNLFIGASGGANYYNAEISEIITYTGTLSATQYNQIQSYLAVKYGITLDQTTPANYSASNGTVLWDATANTTYRYDITGIGRDDASLLDQRKSKSINTGSVLTIEKEIPATPFSTDLDFMLVGDDGGSLGASTNNILAPYPMRVTRIWRAEVTGSPGLVNLSFNLGTGIYNSGNAADYAILIKNTDADFSTGVAHTTGASINSNVITFTGVSLSDGAYFTLALPRVNAPGGVVNNLRAWLKADAGVTGAPSVSAWQDQTTNNFVATQGTAANQPQLVNNRVNFNPSIQFDGSDDQLTITGGIMTPISGTATYSDLNVFAVARVNVVQNSSIFFETQASGGRINAHLPWGNNDVYWDAGGGAAPYRLTVNWGGSVSIPYLWSLLASTSSTALGANQNIVRNGRNISSDATMATFTGNGSNLTVGVNASSNFYNGEVSEMITYTGSLSATQYNRIQSYLAVKYGITLDQTTPTNYSASNGTVLWDATANTTYRYDITGIGRDDASNLNQIKSKSVNSGSIVTIDKGGSFTSDLDFIVFGNDNAYNSPTTVGKHPSYNYRLGKTWRVDINGAPGPVSISFDLSNGIYNSGNVADYALLIHTSADFTAGSAHTAGASLVGNTLTFSNITLNDGDFFTLGMPTPPAPGGVVNNLGIWIKADLGVTGVSNASAWADQSGNNFNLSQSAGANQPAIITNRHNFNPSIQFDGTNDNLSLLGGIFGTNTLTDVYAFGVTRTNIVSASYTFYEAVTGGQFDARTPWSDNILYWEPGNTGTNRVSASTWSATTNIPFLWGLSSSTIATPSGQRQDILRNGFNLASDATMNAFTGNNSAFYLGSGPNSNYFNGEVSELVIYRGDLTGTMLQQIQSYMALKYGITLNGLNYLNSAGANIYGTTTTHSGYARDIAGIGRDDNSALSQTKSKSVNSTPDLITIANNDFTTPAPFSNNNEFIIWGHNGQPTMADANAASITHAGVSIVRQMVRIWSIQKTGAPTGNAIFEVDMGTVVGPSGLGTNNTNDVRLLLDGDATFGNSSLGEQTLIASSVSGNKMYFIVPYASVASGQSYFTIGSVNAITASLTTPTPGGVIGDIRLWLKADAGVTGTTPVTAWADQSTNAFVASASGNSPDLLISQLNNNPVLDFTRSNSEFLRVANGITGLNNYSAMWTFVVSQSDLTGTTNTLSFEATSGGEALSILLPWNDANTYFDCGVIGSTGRVNGNWGGTFGTFNMWTFGSSTSTATPNGTRKTISRDAAVILSNNNSDGIVGGNQNYVIGGGYQNGVGTSNPFDGRIAELIVLGQVPTPLEQEKIHSYLAVKYGLPKNSADLASTIGQDERDFFASDGTIIWDYSANASYSNRVAGIGRDDATALNQQTSRNISTQSLVAMDKGGAFASDKDYVLWGSDNSLPSLTTTGAHPSLTYRMRRVWKVDLTGSPGSVSVIFDLSSGIYNSGNASDYRLLYGNNSSNFASATASVGTLVGNLLTFSGISFNDGDFFTLGIANMPAPGGVVNNLVQWLKADVGVTGAPDVSSWSDQSGGLNNALQATLANQPTRVGSDVNFNPSINFSGSTDFLTPVSATANANATIFSVAVPTVNTTWRTMFRGTVNDHPIIIEAAGNRLGYYDNDNVGFKPSGFSWLQDEPALIGLEMRTGNVNFRKNARQGVSIATINLAGLSLNSFGNYTTNNQRFGRISETAIYDGATALTAAEKARIESYMAIKYGLTFDQTTPTSYYASDWNGTTGTIVWNASLAGLYRNDIATIGRDDNSALSQKQSASVNAGNIVVIGNGSIETDNATNSNPFSANLSFFSWAHNALVLEGSGVTDFQAPIQARVARVWRAQETGTVGTLKLRFNLSTVLGVGGVAGNNDLANVRLLVDADGMFATGATIVTPTTYDNTTDIIEFDHDFAPGTGFFFTFGTIDVPTAPLPIVLKSFAAKEGHEGTIVTWVTASELNNNYFEVQVSREGEFWETVATVMGQGTTSEETKYEVLDKLPYYGRSYYRLRQVDFDGTSSFSKVVSVFYENLGVRMYPNPINGKLEFLTILATDEVGGIKTVKVRNAQGIDVLAQHFTENINLSSRTIDVSELPSAVYLVTVEYERATIVEQLVVLNQH